jgi:crotonobetainyl-CoA:carnitine CoA-transferase CaiB-like acyl-CoA transferase
VLERPDLASDPRFQKIGERFTNWVVMVPLIAEEIRRIPTQTFLERARAEGAPFAPVNDVEDFLADPQVAHRGSVVQLDDPRFGPVRYLAPPIRFEQTPASIDRHAPRLGEHTDEVLRELGVDADVIARLRESGAIR